MAVPLVGLAPAAQVWCLPGEGALALFDDGVRAFPGPVAEGCATLLAQGALPPGQLFAGLGRAAEPTAMIAALDVLRGGGLLVPADALDRRSALDGGEVAPLAAAFGLRAVVGPLPALWPGAAPEGAWVPVTRDPQRISVGPLFRGDVDDPCRACLAARAAAHDDLARLPRAFVMQRPRLTLSAHRTEMAFLRQALALLPDLPPGTILLRAARDGTRSRARALPRGGCPVCETATLNHPVPGPAPLRDGGYRPVAAGTLWPRLQGVIDPVTGIVRDLVQPPRPAALRGLARVVVARHAFPLDAPDPEAILRNRTGRSAGKGRTAAEARVGAVAEALERYAGVARPDDPVMIARARDLEGTVLLPGGLTLYSRDQIAEASRWRALRSAAAFVPDEVDPDAPMAWTAVTNLVTGGAGWAPAALCWHQFPDHEGCALPGRADSNGCAAGQALTDARLQALLELVERDAVALWWWNRARRPQIDPAAFGDAWLRRALAAVQAAGYATALFDLTHDLGVPVIAAVGWPQGGRGPMTMGFGAHPVARTAAARAVTEVLQALPLDPPDRIDGDPRQGFGLLPGCRLDAAGVPDDLGFLIPGEATAAPPQPDGPLPATAGAALVALLDGLTARGLGVWGLDQSRPDVPLPVVRMIVPGLRHFRPRFAPGRLYTLPQRLGWAVGPGRNRLFIRQ